MLMTMGTALMVGAALGRAQHHLLHNLNNNNNNGLASQLLQAQLLQNQLLRQQIREDIPFRRAELAVPRLLSEDVLGCGDVRVRRAKAKKR